MISKIEFEILWSIRCNENATDSDIEVLSVWWRNGQRYCRDVEVGIIGKALE